MKKQQAVGGEQRAVENKSSTRPVTRSLLPPAHRPLPASDSPLPAPLIIGHRGAAAVAPENTLVSFERALLDGADGIEFDVRLARDLVPVVIHDATLRRTALVRGKVESFSSAELSELDAGTWFNLRYPGQARPEYARAGIPTLAAVFDYLRESNALLYVEMKCGPKDRVALAAEVAKLIRAHALNASVVVESFDLAAIAEIKRVDAGLRTAALFDRKLSRPAPSIRKMIEQARECGAGELALHYSLATRRTVEAAAESGFETVVWTVDNPAWVARAIRRNVRALITNDPSRLVREKMIAAER
ncbi:MAG TPA: glycerophosphodiester phosphodiesterase family protein [Pyrinomonadaceae bacterium]|nr:glycerophosphodiester phosphodiesterase family protein [Pyrinomonadaceae bacterium]